MVTSRDIFECPQCGYPYGIFLSDTSICEDISLCPICGYYHCLYLLRDRKKSTGHQQFLKLKQNGDPIQQIYERPGYGVYHVFLCDYSGIVQRFAYPPTQRKIQRLIKRILALGENHIDWELTYVTIWDEENSRAVCIFGNMPEDYSVGRSQENGSTT